MTLSKFKEKNLLGIVLIVLALIQYYLLNHLNNVSQNYIDVAFFLDYSIKLIPGFLIPYYSIYILLLFVLILLIRKDNYVVLTEFLFSIVILWSLINFAHAFFPVMNYIRPEIKETSFFFEAVNKLYKSVNPFNTMPSWHVSTAVLCAIVFYNSKFKRSWLVIFWTFLICLSPLFLKMAYIADVIVAIPLPFICFKISNKLSTVTVRTESVKEIVKIFSLESLIQSVAIGIRDENTISSLIDNLTRIEKNLTESDKEEIKILGAEMDPPKNTLKEIINDLIMSISIQNQIQKAKELFSKNDKSFVPSEQDIKAVTEEMVNKACLPFDLPKFRYRLLQIKKRNSELINSSSIQEASKEKSKDVVLKFNSFIESHKNDLTVLKTIYNNTNGHSHFTSEEIMEFVSELRKPPYEISAEEIWKAYHVIDTEKVKPLGEEKSHTNIISLTQFALGKIDKLEPYSDEMDIKLNEWIDNNVKNGRKFTEEELMWIRMMKEHISSKMEINMISFNDPPFISKGGASKAYKIFGPDLNRIMYELNEKLI
ncbi:MAG TPA: type I restriction-modification enzyme R subunit C-terminal domain-containing protein [Ignavibacteria bacterium]|nr:type I restriction-modification enzyme R subunit C-terminal domain-containing protein [Ignavibacteria bacterium]